MLTFLIKVVVSFAAIFLSPVLGLLFVALSGFLYAAGAFFN
jgi:hypothetical protein